MGIRLDDFSQKYLGSVFYIIFLQLPGPAAYNLPSTVEGSDGIGRKIN